MILLTQKSTNRTIQVPTNIREINEEVFNSLLKNVVLGDNYVVVALISSNTPFRIANYRNDNNATANVFYRIAKISKKNAESSGYNIMDTPIISRTDVERGNHIHVGGNDIAFRVLEQFMNNDTTLKSKVTTGDFPKVAGAEYIGKNPIIYTLDFKIIPLNNIHAAVKTKEINEHPFDVTKVDASLVN